LCGCVADRVRDAQDFDEGVRRLIQSSRRLRSPVGVLRNGGSRRILLKNPLFWRQHLGFVAMSAWQTPGASP
jgi:hypothetical protein